MSQDIRTYLEAAVKNGAADLFFSLVTAERPKKALIPVPAFSEYEQALRTADCQIRYHQTEEKENFRLTERFLEELTEDLDLVFLCSPSNPAGQVIPEELLRRVIRRCGEKKIPSGKAIRVLGSSPRVGGKEIASAIMEKMLKSSANRQSHAIQ